MSKIRIATVWLDGCSGCHMSFLDMDERLLAVAEKIDLVYSPLVDAKEFPENVDLTIVEGAVSNVKTIMSFGPGGQLMPFLDLGLWAFGEAETAASSIGEPMAQSLIEQTLAAAAAAKAAAK